jgi:hypothetical protein
LEECVFTKLLETKGLKLFHNVKPMGFPCYPLLKSYYKVQNSSGENEWWPKHCGNNKTNLGYLYDIEMVMGLTCIMSMLRVVRALIKFAQGRKTYMYVILWLLLKCVVLNYTCI